MSIRVTDYLQHRGWVPIDDSLTLWTREGRPDEVVTFFWAASRENIVVPHAWDEHFACTHCGMTQYRVLLQGESSRCMGVPDAKAFEDAATYDKLTDRIKRALGGEEGLIWDNKND